MPIASARNHNAAMMSNHHPQKPSDAAVVRANGAAATTNCSNAAYHHVTQQLAQRYMGTEGDDVYEYQQGGAYQPGAVDDFRGHGYAGPNASFTGLGRGAYCPGTPYQPPGHPNAAMMAMMMMANMGPSYQGFPQQHQQFHHHHFIQHQQQAYPQYAQFARCHQPPVQMMDVPPSPQEVMHRIPVPPGCFLCPSQTHWYTACPHFDGGKLCFLNERDQRVYVMRHEDWIRGAVLRNVNHFLRVATGLAPSQYHLVVNGSLVPSDDRGMRCCDVGMLPGALVYVVLTDSCRYLLFPHPQGADMGNRAQEDAYAAELLVSQERHHGGVRSGHRPSAPVLYDEVEEEAVESDDAITVHGDAREGTEGEDVLQDGGPMAAHRLEASCATAEEEEPLDVNVSHISVASTGLLRSIPASHGSRTSHRRNNDPPSGGETTARTAATPLSTDDNTTDGHRKATPSAAAYNDTSGSSATSSYFIERPENISTWADLSVASHGPNQSLTGNVCAAVLTAPHALVTVASPARDPQEDTGCPSVSANRKAASKSPMPTQQPAAGVQAPAPAATSTSGATGGATAGNNQHHTVHIKFVPSSMSFPELRKLFFAVGKVLRVRIVDPENAAMPVEQRFCVAFVEYSQATEAANCIERYHKKRLGRFRLAVSYSARPISGGYVTDAVDGQPCTFGCASADATPNAKRGGGAKGTPDLQLGAQRADRPTRRARSPGAKSRAHGPAVDAPACTARTPSLRRGNRSVEEGLAADGAYKLTPKFESAHHHHRSPNVADASPNTKTHPSITMLTTPTTARSSGERDRDGSHTTTTPSAPRTVSKCMVVVATSPDGPGLAKHKSSPAVESSVLRLHSIPSSKLRMVHGFDKIVQLLHEYLRSSVEATYYNVHALLERLSTTCVSTRSDLLIDVVLLQIALHVHFGGATAVQDAIELGHTAVIKAAYQLVRPSEPHSDGGCPHRQFAALFDVRHAVHCMVAAAALLQHSDDGLATSLLAKTRDVAWTTWPGCPMAHRFKEQLEVFTKPFLGMSKRNGQGTTVTWILHQLFPCLPEDGPLGATPTDGNSKARAVAAIVLGMEPAADLSKL